MIDFFPVDELGAKFLPLDELLKKSDVIVVATPLNSETFEMFDDECFAKMKKNAVFVNVGRGKIVKTDALVRALKNKIIFAAGLDVTDPEPLPTDHELLKLPNVGEKKCSAFLKKKLIIKSNQTLFQIKQNFSEK